MPFHRKPSKAKRLSLVRYNMKGLTQMRDSEEKWGGMVSLSGLKIAKMKFGWMMFEY